jgi:hypothetical protein
MSGTEFKLTPSMIDEMTFPQLLLYFEKPKLSVADAIRLAKKNKEKE